MDDVDADLRVLDLGQLADGGLDGAADVALEDEVELLDPALLHRREEPLEGNAGLRALRQLLAAQPLAPHLREVACLALVLDDRQSSPAGGGLSKPRISTGSPGCACVIFSPR